MSKLSQLVSTILGFHIPEGKWKQQLDIIDKSGEPTMKHMGMMIFAVCQEMEEMETKLADLQFQLEERKSHASTNKS
jgi:hypothetical protein